MVQKCLIRFLACTQLRDFVYNRKCFWINTGASVDYRKLSSDVLQTIKNRGVNIIRINDTDVYEDNVCDKDIDALTTCMRKCTHDIDPQVLVISQTPVRLRTTQTVFSGKFRSLTCLVLRHNLKSEGRIAAVEQQAFVAVLKAMPNLTQLFAYIIVHTSRRMSKMLM